MHRQYSSCIVAPFVGLPEALSHVQIVSVAFGFDLTVTSSAIFYCSLVRPRFAPWWQLGVAVLTGIRIVSYLLPSPFQLQFFSAKWVALPFEMLVLGRILRRIRDVSPLEGDVPVRIRAAVCSLFPNPLVNEIIAGEIITLYYALFSWRAKPEASTHSRSFSYAEARATALGLFC